MNDFPAKRMGDGWQEPDQAKHEAAIGRRKEITVDSRDWVVEATDPYGFWQIVDPSGGKVADQLRGQYTGFDLAVNDIKLYMKQNPLSAPRIQAKEEGTTPPPLKTKKVVRRKQPQEAATVDA